MLSCARTQARTHTRRWAESDSKRFTAERPSLTHGKQAAQQLQLEVDPVVPLGGVYPHVPRLDRGDEIIPHFVHVVGVALENLQGNKVNRDILIVIARHQ